MPAIRRDLRACTAQVSASKTDFLFWEKAPWRGPRSRHPSRRVSAGWPMVRGIDDRQRSASSPQGNELLLREPRMLHCLVGKTSQRSEKASSRNLRSVCVGVRESNFGDQRRRIAERTARTGAMILHNVDRSRAAYTTSRAASFFDKRLSFSKQLLDRTRRSW